MLDGPYDIQYFLCLVNEFFKGVCDTHHFSSDLFLKLSIFLASQITEKGGKILVNIEKYLHFCLANSLNGFFLTDKTES